MPVEMKLQHVPAMRGATWVRQGFRAFALRPLAFMALLFFWSLAHWAGSGASVWLGWLGVVACLFLAAAHLLWLLPRLGVQT